MQIWNNTSNSVVIDLNTTDSLLYERGANIPVSSSHAAAAAEGRLIPDGQHLVTESKERALVNHSSNATNLDPVISAQICQITGQTLLRLLPAFSGNAHFPEITRPPPDLSFSFFPFRFSFFFSFFLSFIRLSPRHLFSVFLRFTLFSPYFA